MTRRNWGVPPAERTYMRFSNIFCYTATVDGMPGYTADALNGRQSDGTLAESPLCTMVTEGVWRLTYDDDTFDDLVAGDIWSIKTHRPDIKEYACITQPTSFLSFFSDALQRQWNIDPYILKAPLALPAHTGLRCVVVGNGTGDVDGVPYTGPQLFYFPKGKAITITPTSDTPAIVFGVAP